MARPLGVHCPSNPGSVPLRWDMRPITQALQDNMWRGKRAFIVGSGPSLKGFDFSCLRGELTIGVNEEYLWGPTIALCQDKRFFCGDHTLGRLGACMNPDWCDRKGMLPVYFHGHPDDERPTGIDEICIVEAAHSREAPFRWGSSLNEGLYYGANVGMAALNLADILGADPIYLLGFDANASAEATHHHDAYPPEWKMACPEDKVIVFRRWIEEFRKIAKKVKASVINLNPDSGIDAFPKAKLSFMYDKIIPVGL